MEADISIWQKTGHFYFALTETLYHAANRVATITLNRPDKLNAWTAVMEREVRAAMGEAGADSVGARICHY